MTTVASTIYSTQHFLFTFVPERPQKYVPMLGPDKARKYAVTVDKIVTDSHIHAHLKNEQTIAIPLIDSHGCAKIGGLETDQGGEAGIRTALAIATAYGYSAFVETYPKSPYNDEHHGGYLWIKFDEPTKAERIKRAMEELKRELCRRTGIPEDKVETFPTGLPRRLPFGKHLWSDSYGTSYFQDGYVFDGSDINQRREAYKRFIDLPANPVSVLPEEHVIVVVPQQSTPPSMGENPYHSYNQQTCLLDLVLQYGGNVASYCSDGTVLVHCPCGMHSHGDRNPSLHLKPAKNPAYGTYVAMSYREGCKFYTGPKKVIDTFEAYCLLSGKTKAQAVEYLGLDPHTAIRNAAQCVADKDERLSENERLVLLYLLWTAEKNKRVWCRPSLNRIVDDTGIPLRTVQRVLARLRQYGYVKSSKKTGGTTIRTIQDLRDKVAHVVVEPPVSTEAEDPAVPPPDQTIEEVAHVVTVFEPEESADVTSGARIKHVYKQELHAPPIVPPTAAPPKIEEGAVFDPGSALLSIRASPEDWSKALSPKDWYSQHLHKPEEIRLKPGGEEEPPAPQLVVVTRRSPPRNATQKEAYNKLLGKAKRVAKTKPGQAKALRQEAWAMESVEYLLVLDDTNILQKAA